MPSDSKQRKVDAKDIRQGKHPDLEKKNKKKGGKKKPWVLEHRYVGDPKNPSDMHSSWVLKIWESEYSGEWFKGQKYKTEDGAVQAMERHERTSWIFAGEDWESRVRDTRIKE